MSLQRGCLRFILLFSLLAASTTVINENISSTEVKLEAWDTLTLHCNATEVPGATVVWRREDSRNIILRNEELFESVKEEFSTIEGDPLILKFIRRGDKGVYICNASNGVDPSVRKRFIVEVEFPPEFYVPRSQWNIHGLLGEDATFRCFIAALPRGTNTWILHPGTYKGTVWGQYETIPLANSDKYVIEETQVHKEVTLMQLTVRNLEPADYLIYSCTSRNRLGNVQYDRRLRNYSIEHWLL